MFSQILRLLALSAPISALNLPRQYSQQPTSNVTVVDQSKSVNATNGTADVAIGGYLVPFGTIGAGCGVNWNENVSYGGGLQGGSNDFGLGGGFTITPDTLSIGMGIGITPSNASADVNFVGHTNATFTVRFTSSEPLTCVPTVEDGRNVVSCSTS